MSDSTLPATVFIRQDYLTHPSCEFLIELPGFGWGIELAASELGQSIRSGRVAATVLPDNFIAIVHETAMAPN